MTPSQQLRYWAHELASMARIGLEFSRDDPYDLDRYERVAVIADGIAGLTIDASFTPDRPFLADVGYATPKVGVAVAALGEDGRVALIRRADNGRWAMPGGFAEVGSSPEENALRELREEAGLEAELDGIVGVYDNRHFRSTAPYHIYGICFSARVTGGELRTSIETTDVRWFDPAELPGDMVASHRAMLEHAFRGERGVSL